MTSEEIGPLLLTLVACALVAGPAAGQVCGDGVLDMDEICDDGNTTPGDGTLGGGWPAAACGGAPA